MFHINNHSRTRRDASPGRRQSGFSMIEVLVSMTVMLIVVGAVFSLMKDSMKVSMVTYELTDAQQNLRTAQEFINRDIMNAGDGLKGFGDIRIPQLFYTSYVTLVPGSACNAASICNLAIFTTDNVVPAGTVITGSVPAANILTGTDRQTILAIDSEFNGGQPISLLKAHSECSAPVVAVAASINGTGTTVRIPVDPCTAGTPGPAMSMFTVGEIYFFAAPVGGLISGTFGAITGIAGRTLTFAAADPYGLNANHIQYISTSGTVDTTMQRMKIIQYYVTDTKLLMRRVFGIEGFGARQSIIAEHVLDVQFSYGLIETNSATGVVTPSTTVTLSTPEQRVAVRQVDVKVRVETPHATRNGNRQPLEMTTSTSVRNMQFRNAN
jgi:prepilin-type N-terminal cleavage/methylation domain-containing protein